MDWRKLESVGRGFWYWNPANGQFSDEQAETVPLCNGHLTVAAPTAGKGQDWIVLITETNGGKPIIGAVYAEEEAQTGAKKVFEWYENNKLSKRSQ